MKISLHWVLWIESRVSFAIVCNVRRYVLLAPLRGGACFCTRDVL